MDSEVSDIYCIKSDYNSSHAWRFIHKEILAVR